MGDNQLEVEDSTQLEAYDHSVIAPLEQFFNKELKLNELQVILEKTENGSSKYYFT
jgi:hypothetical protein